MTAFSVYAPSAALIPVRLPGSLSGSSSPVATAFTRPGDNILSRLHAGNAAS